MAKHHNKAERSAIVGAWRTSGLTAGNFARERGMSQTSILRWAAEVDDAAPAFVRLELPTKRTSAGLAVHIGPVRILVERGFDGALLRELVDVLSGEGK